MNGGAHALVAAYFETGRGEITVFPDAARGTPKPWRLIGVCGKRARGVEQRAAAVLKKIEASAAPVSLADLTGGDTQSRHARRIIKALELLTQRKLVVVTRAGERRMRFYARAA